MDKEYIRLSKGNQLYENNKDRLLFLYQSYIGGEEYKKAKLLTRYQLETDAEYNARLNTTPLDNQCQSVVSVYKSFLFREQPDRDFGSIENLPELNMFLSDADLEGRSFNNFMKEVSTWASVFGHTWVIMTKPNINALTRQDEIANEIRPYVSVLTPLVVLDWSWDRKPNGRYELNYLRYVEEVNGSVQVIKEWTSAVIITTELDTKFHKVLSSSEEINELGLIPAVIAYNNRSIIRGYGISSINDIADMQKFIYNCTSEVDQSIRLDSHPSLVKTSDTQAEGTGAGAIIQMSENLDPNLKPYVLDFAGANITNIYDAINNTITSIEKMANIGSVRGTESKTMSGIAMETEFQLLNSRLSEMADNLELTEEQLWRLFCLYQDQTYDMTISYPGSFAIRDTGRQIEELRAAASTNPSDPKVKAAIDYRIYKWIDLSEDEENDLVIPTEPVNSDTVVE